MDSSNSTKFFLKITCLEIVWSLRRLQQLSIKTFYVPKITKMKKKNRFENIRDFFCLVANPLGDVVVKNL